MRTSISSKGVELTESLKAYTEEKLVRLQRFFSNITDLRVRYDTDGPQAFKAEIQVALPKHNVFVCSATESTTTAAIDVALDKAERKLTEFKTQLRTSTEKSTKRFIHKMKEGKI